MSPAQRTVTRPPTLATTVPAQRLAIKVRPRHLAVAGVLALSAVLNTYRLSQNGYANVFYSAGVKSMLRSLHNFVFVSFDPGGLITLDKPPLGLWLQAASAKLFGFSALSLLLPEAIAGVLAVAVLYRALARHLSPAAGIGGALAMAVFPSFVAVSRDNGPDPVLILMMVLACSAGLRAIETGRWRTVLWCGALIGLAFNTKALAALLVVPGIAVAYLVGAPGPMGRRALQVLAAGAVMVAVSFSWIAFVDLTPAAQRPFVGDTTNNSELGLTFGYNGFGRIGGQVGAPGRVPGRSGTLSPPTRRTLVNGRNRYPIPFGGPTGPLRLFGAGLGDQAGWLVPLALSGLLALVLLAAAELRRVGSHGRRDPRLAVALVFGTWFVVEGVVLSVSSGIVHPYYASALAPGVGAMVGAGAVAFVALTRGPLRRHALALLAGAVLASLAAQIVLLHREHYMAWFIPVLAIGAAGAFVALLLRRRLAAPAMALLFGLLLVAPAAYAATTWLVPVAGTFPAAGPRTAAGPGGVGVTGRSLVTYRELVRYVEANGAGSRWALLTDAAPTAAPFILLGVTAGALGGYGGTDPAIDGPGLARLVARSEARYVVLGGEFASRGGNRATAAVERSCRVVRQRAWHGPETRRAGLTLYDCAGRQRRLAAS